MHAARIGRERARERELKTIFLVSLAVVIRYCCIARHLHTRREWRFCSYVFFHYIYSHEFEFYIVDGNKVNSLLVLASTRTHDFSSSTTLRPVVGRAERRAGSAEVSKIDITMVFRIIHMQRRKVIASNAIGLGDCL